MTEQERPAERGQSADDWDDGLAERLAEYVIWQTLFAQHQDDLDDLDTAQVWSDVIERLDDAIQKIWHRWDAAKAK